jgi:hypothetical protein
MLTLAGVAGVPDGTLLTPSRPLFEQGLPGQEGRLRFASYGDPAFDAILAQTDALPLPRCARRLSVTLEVIPQRSSATRWLAGATGEHGMCGWLPVGIS